MSKAKVWELINKRKQHKKKRTRNPNVLVARFIDEVDKIQESVSSAEIFWAELVHLSNRLSNDFKGIDPDVEMKLVWNREDRMTKDTNWKDLRLEGVKITWSKWWRGKHPFSDPEAYIDVGTLFVDGYLGDKEE